jgi:hypothetical protein
MYAVFGPLYSYTRRFTALGTDQHYIRDVKRSLKFDPSGGDGAPLGLDLLLMLGMHIQAPDDLPPLVRHDFDHLTALAFLLDLAADKFNGITFSNLYFHRSLLNWPKALPEPAKQSS